MHLAIVGTGYVGLVTGACLAQSGHDVICADNDAAKINALKAGRMPIFEPGLETVTREQVKAGRLAFTTDACSAAACADAVFIAVGTPALHDGRTDISYVASAATEIAPALKPETVVIMKSTVPVGTGAYIARLIEEANPNAHVMMASNPEFLREGSAVNDFLHPDRIVIGVEDERALALLREIYRPQAESGTPIVATGIATAELTKYAANAFLATKVAYINEIANLCDSLGANIDDVAHALGLDKRIGSAFLKPGPGYGGSCFPKDTLALSSLAHEADCPVRIVEAVASSNVYHVRRLVKRLENECSRAWGQLGYDSTKLRGKRIAILGLSFKSNTDDVRFSAGLVVIPHLERCGASVRAFDPAAMDNARRALPGLRCCEGIVETITGADAVVILTEWDEFREIDWSQLAPQMAAPVVFDMRNLSESATMREQGIYYISLGRPTPGWVAQTWSMPDGNGIFNHQSARISMQ